MAFTCGFFNSVAHDRKYDAVQHGMIFDGIITDGIYATYLKAMVVKASENASEVIVQPGRAWFNHTWSYNDSDYPVAAPEPEVVLDRIDTLVLDVNSEDAVRNNQFLWVQGTPTSQTPEPPELIHTATHNQYPLCDVYRQAGTTMIYAADITNRVGTSDCPFVTGVLESIDIDDLLAQWDDEFHTWENATKASFEGWMLNQQSVYTAWFNALKTQMAGDVADVEAWVQTIKDIIDEETATHLQLEIDEINSMLPSGSHITVTTSDTELYSRTVTITDEDNNTVTSQFDANGVAVFKSVPYVGNLTITSTDGVRTATEVVNTPYFARYEFTLAFWSATVNIIGDSVFGGDTVTITDSTTALVGTVVLNASGAGVFNATYPDTYKFSVTHGGETMEVSLAVTQETTYNVEIHAGLNYQAWLNAGRVSKSFSSLDEVLEDEKTLRQLFLVHDAVDYVASQRVNDDLTKIFNTDLAAKWINNSDYALEHFYAVTDIKTVMDAADKYGYGEWCLMPQVPTMTGNAAPYGEVIYSNLRHGTASECYKIFASSNTTIVTSFTEYFDAYIGYDFLSPKIMNKIYLRSGYYTGNQPNFGIEKFIVQGSNDKSNWTSIVEITKAENTQDYYAEFENNTAYRYYAIRLTKTFGDQSYGGIVGLQFYAWAPKGNVPVMTGDSAPYGVASAESVLTNYPAYKAFDDGSGDSRWVTNKTISVGGTGATWIQYKFINPTAVKRLFASFYADDVQVYEVTKMEVLASNDGSTFTPIYTDNTSRSISVGNNAVNLDFENSEYYLYWRVNITIHLTSAGTHTASNLPQLWSLQFYGRELKVSVPTMTSNTAPYGEVSESGHYDNNYLPYMAFKGFNSSASSGNSWAASAGSKHWIGYAFTDKTKVKAFSFGTYNNSSRAFTGIKLLGSNDNFVNDSHELYSDSEAYGSAVKLFTYLVENDEAYKYYRLEITKNGATTSTSPLIGGINFYGLDYSEKEFEVGTTKKWLYDHGVYPSDSMVLIKGQIGIAPIDDESQIWLKSGTNSTNSTSQFAGIFSENTIDLTPYSLEMMKIGNKFEGGALTCSIGIWTTRPNEGGSYSDNNKIAETLINTPITHNIQSLDISAVNESRYVSVGCYYVKDRVGSLTEFWLE